MHAEAFYAMALFTAAHVKQGMAVADVGSCDVNGTFRPLFPHCAYTGLDVVEGPNVDRIVKSDDFGAMIYDVVISGNVAEHVADLRKFADECVRILKPGGTLCVIAPHATSGFAEHRHPVDCWRILPDGMLWLFRDLEILDCRMDARDTVLIGRKTGLP